MVNTSNLQRFIQVNTRAVNRIGVFERAVWQFRKKSVCLITMEVNGNVVSAGTGVLIAHDIVLTTAHTLGQALAKDPNVNETGLRFLFNVANTAETADFKFRNRAKRALEAKTPKYKFMETIEEKVNTDFVLFRIDRPELASDDVFPFAIETDKITSTDYDFHFIADPGQVLCLQHPLGRPMEVAGGLVKRVNQAPPAGAGEVHLAQFDSTHGSSGSPIVSANDGLIGILKGTQRLGDVPLTSMIPMNVIFRNSDVLRKTVFGR